jgi:Dolichyl-phosphate-mannose-protein mannosyltransferase/C-terminal four TMM region of protein-O-mannosyltransferase
VPDRGTTAPTRSFEAALTLVAILVLGLALRLIIAYVLLPGSGFGADRDSFQAWAGELAANGPYGFYDRGFFIDYTPGYLYVLWLVGVVGNAIGGIGDLIKLPPILADVALAWLVHSLVRELGGSRRAATIGAVLVIVNPVAWFDSAIWGQVDSFGVIFLLLGLRELWRGRPERASFFAVIGAVIKPQLGILIPILAVVLLRRHLWDRLRGARAAPAAGADLLAGPHGGPWPARLGEGPIRLVTSAAVAFGTAIGLCVPFGMSLVGLLEQVAKAAGGYPYVTVNAYNPWALLTQGGNGLAANGLWLRDVAGDKPDQVATLVGGVPAVYVGTVVLVAIIVLVCALVARGGRPSAQVIEGEEGPPGPPGARALDDRRLLLVALTVMGIAFFVAPTRVHERYLFPFVALGAILAATSSRWRVAYVVLSLASFANLYAILLTPFYQNPGVTDWLGLGDAIRSPLGVTAVAGVHLAVFLWALTELRPRALRRLDRQAIVDTRRERVAGAGLPEARPSGEIGERDPLGGEEPVVDDRKPDRTDRPGSPAPLAWDGSPALAESVSSPAGGSGLPLPFGLGGVRTLMADRSRRLAGEGGGRFDRFDLWLVVVIVVAALVLRTFRLSEPYRMHFDEVYHARTATEFLQDWRYGEPHTIYEYTHPHLAKYAMAVGLVIAGDDRVTAQRSLGTAVRDVLVEPRWDDPSVADGRAGDRFYVAGADQVRAYDLATRAQITAWSVPGASALALDPTGHRLLVGTDGGSILALDTSAQLDGLRGQPGGGGTALDANLGGPVEFATVGAPVSGIALTDDGTGMAAATPSGDVVLVDPGTGDVLARTHLEGLAGLADGGLGNGLTADPASVADPAAEASVLADLVGGQATDYERRLTAATTDGSGQVVVLGGFPNEQRSALDTAIADGRLAGLTITPLPRIAASDAAGVSFIDPVTGQVVDTVGLDAAGRGMAKVTGIDKPTLYVATSDHRVAVIQIGEADAKARPSLQTTFWMPGDVRNVVYDEPTGIVHVLGTAPDGSGDTIYVVEPHANAVFADARLPFTAAAWALDADGQHPSIDRQDLLVASSDGTLGSVDTGDHAFAWRLPGVLAGALMAGLIFLLARMLFRRREVAVLAAILVLVDGMLFVQSRIAMNDVYVGLFIVAAYTLFAALWTGRWRSPWAFWVVLPTVGVLLGLALASKWVGLYAIAGIVLLILGRSALGRIVLILGLALGTTILGYMALAVPPGATTSAGNYLFVGLMIALTLGATVVTVLHPIAWSVDETRLAIVGPAALGIVVFLAAVPLGIASRALTLGSVALTPIEIALGLILASGGVWVALRLAGMFGLGPLAALPEPDDPVRLTEPGSPPPDGWLRPGAMLGLPMAWAVLSLAVIPLAVYVVSYLPWVALGNRITDTWPPGNNGQTLLDLTRQMYDYHNGLRATHAASSPYWAWPFDLKPVWFYQDSFAAGTAAAIYDAGNLVAWWLSIAATAFVAWQAFKRRSLGLALIFVAFAFQWMPWARIDRATFQYHYYAALPFLLVALAYFLAELRNGPSPRTWALARLAAAGAILGPALMWALKGPLCTFVRVTAVNPGSEACVATAPGQIVLTWRSAGLAAVLIVAGVLLVVQLLRLGSSDRPVEAGAGRFVWIGLTALVGIAALVAVPSFLPDAPIVSQDGFRIEPIAFVVLVGLAPIAWVVATARDARRFVAGAVLACVVWFVAWYPNLSGLPLPSAIVNAYQGLLPTYLYPFQFPVNTDPVVTGLKLIGIQTAALGLALLVTCVIVGYSTWTWRIAIAEREAERTDPGPAAQAGGPG